MPIAQPEARSSTRLTVRLTPSTATEPLTARKRASDGGASTSSAHDSPTGSKRVTRPTPSTWPETRWPSSRASARIAFSRLTSPAASRPAVLSRLSAEISTWKRSRLGLEPDDGHAGARQGDAVAEGDVVEKARRRLDRERLAEGRAGAERPRFDDAADAADDAGEHGVDCRRRRDRPRRREGVSDAGAGAGAGRRRRGATSTMRKSRLCSSRSNGPSAARPRPLPSRRGAT